MIMRYEGGKTWPYPTRSVEFVDGWYSDDFEGVVIELNELETDALKWLDKGLFEELKRIKKIKVEKVGKTDMEADKRKELVKETYWNSEGVIDGFPELERTVREPIEESFMGKVNELRSFKLKIKDLLRQIEDDGDALARSTKNVLDIYRKYVNVALADLLLSSSDSLKNSEKLDKFVKGVFSEIDEERNFVVLGKPLLEYVEKLEAYGEEKCNYPDVWLDEDDVELVAKTLLKKLGASDWVVVRRTTDKSTLGVYKPKKEIRVGKRMKRKMEEILPVIAHEIEAHVMHGNNESEKTYTPLVIKNYSAGGRDNLLSEMFGRWVEDETRVKMGLERKKPETLYFRTLQKKKGGANFIECFDFYFKNYLERQKFGFDLVMKDREKYEIVFDHVYDRTMRLFRKGAPLSDRNNYLITTDQLKYLEQSLVLTKLEELGLENLMFLDGADLYSTMQIKELGLLEGIEQNRPKFLLAEEIWPVIKKGLDEGREIKDVLEDLKIE